MTAAGIPYEGTDCTADEAVEAVKAVRAETAATRDYPLVCERTGRRHDWQWDDDWNESYCPDCGVETGEDVTYAD